MNLPQIAVLAVLAMVVTLLWRRVFPPPVVFLTAVAVLTAAGLLSPVEALAGFANESIAVMILLISISSVIRKTGVLEWFFERKLRPSHRYRRFLAQLMPFVAGVSSFMNNTPVVAMLVPVVRDWGKRNGVALSKLLIPVSYAAILGGMTTLIGTSTNLIVNSLSQESGLGSMSILDFTPVGLMMLGAGLIYILFAGYRMLPSRREPADGLIENPREYLVETVISEGSELAGKTVEKARLRNLKGLFLTEIVRDGRKIVPVSPEEVLEEGDTLILAGDTATVADLITSSRGLSLRQLTDPPAAGRLKVIEAVVSNRSTLAGSKVRNSEFRGRFNAAILAVHRQGERLRGKIGEIVLQPGDLLLLLAGSGFRKRVESGDDLFLISKVAEIHKIDTGRAVFTLVSMFACIGLAIAGVVPLFRSLIVLLALFLITRTMSLSDLRRSLDMNLLAVAVFALALGRAVTSTGLGTEFSCMVISVSAPLGVIGIIAALYLVTNVLAGLVTTVAAASIVFPFAAVSAAALGVDPKPFVLAVAYGATANFSTPVGYQTNLMVYGPGGYRFGDYFRIGAPLSLICWVVATLGLGLVYGLI